MHHAWLPLALALVLVASSLAPTAATVARVTCSSPEECCNVCGDDSYRCARGTCTSNVVPKRLFFISLPMHIKNVWDVVFVFYSIVPSLVPLALGLTVLLHRRRGWTLIFAFLFIPIAAVINSLILVKSLGDCAKCPRPCGSCVAGNGMPSGHATNAIGLCLWIILETFLGVGKHWYKRKQVAVVLSSMLLLLPVPYSRMYLGDHTPLQVTLGSAHGIVLGLIYFLLLRYCIAKKLDRASQWFARGKCPITIVNDFSKKKPSGLGSAPTSPSSDNLETGGLGAQSDRAYAAAPATPMV